MDNVLTEKINLVWGSKGIPVRQKEVEEGGGEGGGGRKEVLFIQYL